MAHESFQANYCRVFVFDLRFPHNGLGVWKTKLRPWSNSPEMTRRPQKTLGIWCLATLRSSFYIVVGVFVFGLRFPHTGLGVWKTKTLDSLSIVLNNMNDVFFYLLFGILFFWGSSFSGSSVFVFQVFVFHTPAEAYVPPFAASGNVVLEAKFASREAKMFLNLFTFCLINIRVCWQKASYTLFQNGRWFIRIQSIGPCCLVQDKIFFWLLSLKTRQEGED